jgi:soluble lytic murein transglycosylase
MQLLRWMLVLLGGCAAVAFAAEGPFQPGANGTSRREQPLFGVEIAQRLPFEPNKIEPIDPKAAFVEGYRAYEQHDLIATIGRMRLAASQLPNLADYALFYLASAERDNRDIQAAADDFRQLTISYPQSVWSGNAGLDYAQLELKLGHPDYSLAAATAVVNTTSNDELEQNARLTMVSALLATNSWRAAYNQAQMLRQKFPTGSADAAARRFAYAILQAHPQGSNVPPLEYHRTEAALLLREGQDNAALNQIRAAMALLPPKSIRVELTWLSAEASRAQPDRMKIELQLYLELAPRGSQAARALNGLAHLYWHENDTLTSRLYFNRLVREFPHDELAPTAMFETGRTYEEDGNLESARLAYLKLISRYPGTEAAGDARFRADFMLYMLGRYQQAAGEFGDSRTHAATAAARDMFGYWQARSFESSGQTVEAMRLFETVALSTSSNYYPALAAKRINRAPAVLPAAFAADLKPGPVPSISIVDGQIQFHLARVALLRELGLRGLEAPELRAVEGHLGNKADLREFVLAELQSTGAWSDAIQMAMRMTARGELDPATAERIRYPRGFWDLIAAASSRNQLDPYLVTALIRQESLFDPKARSIADARGLMQLLPATANRYAIEARITAYPVDLYDPDVSIQLGTVYLRDLKAMFGGNTFKVVAAYNAGEHAVAQWNARYPGDDDQWVENIGFRETRDYVKKVIGGMREYRLLYGSHSGASISTRVQ